MKNVLEYLEYSAAQYPNKIAFSDESGTVTFASLLKSAKSIGTMIARRTEKTGVPIGVTVERLVRTPAAFFGVLYSGNYYVPLDPDMPEARLERIITQLCPEFILYPEDQAGCAPARQTCSIPYQMEAADIDEALLAERRSRVLDIDPVYVIYTSGSTGMPKGIVISHQSVIDFIDWMSETLSFCHEDVFANQAPFYFDCSVKDLYLTLKLGATDHIIPKKLFLFPTLLIDFLNEHKVTALTWATSGFHLVSQSGILEKKRPEYLQKVAIGGEAMLARHLNRWRAALPGVTYTNLYGPTEVTVDCTYHVIDREYKDHEAIPIGKGCANKQVLLLDENLNEVPVGEAGEICVRGIGIAKGYFGDPEKTDAAFVRNPHLPYIDYIYRTGDIGRRNPEGDIVFQSRKDGQIKHMGYRIELGEIERALNSLTDISSAVCFYDAACDRIVCAYTGDANKKDIAVQLGKLVPKYMIPNIYIPLGEMPFNANGKIDRVKIKHDYDEENNRLS